MMDDDKLFDGGDDPIIPEHDKDVFDDEGGEHEEELLENLNAEDESEDEEDYY